MIKDPDTGRTDRPIIAALDPRRHDFAPAALGILLARLTRARLILGDN